MCIKMFHVSYHIKGKIKIPLRKSKNDQKNFPLARKRAREQKFPHPQTAYNLRKNGARHPLSVIHAQTQKSYFLPKPIIYDAIIE